MYACSFSLFMGDGWRLQQARRMSWTKEQMSHEQRKLQATSQGLSVNLQPHGDLVSHQLIALSPQPSQPSATIASTTSPTHSATHSVVGLQFSEINFQWWSGAQSPAPRACPRMLASKSTMRSGARPLASKRNSRVTVRPKAALETSLAIGGSTVALLSLVR